MPRSLLALIATLFVALLAVACAAPRVTTQPPTPTPFASAATPSPSPHTGAGGEMVFVADIPAFGPTIFRTDAASGDVVKLTDGESPAWSPDGSRIAFARTDAAGLSGIWLMDPDGGSQVRLVDGFAPAWSSDGTVIAFSRSTIDEGDLLVMKADGSGVTGLPGGLDHVWSPVGPQVLTVIGTAQPHIVIVNEDGSIAARLADGKQPAWSPDGSRVAYVGWSAPSRIQVLTVATGADVAIGSLVDYPYGPAWSPDGSRVAYVGWQGDLYVAPVDGGDTLRLTNGLKAAGRPVWSPDGALIALPVAATQFGATVTDIWLVPIDKSGGRQFTTTGNASAPAWRPAP